MTAFRVFLSCKMRRSHKVSLGIRHIKVMNKRENKIKFCFVDQEKYPGIHYGVCYEPELWAVGMCFHALVCQQGDTGLPGYCKHPDL